MKSLSEKAEDFYKISTENILIRIEKIGYDIRNAIHQQKN